MAGIPDGVARWAVPTALVAVAGAAVVVVPALAGDGREEAARTPSTAQLARQVTALQRRVRVLERRRPLRGARGTQGPAGVPGAAGAPGAGGSAGAPGAQGPAGVSEVLATASADRAEIGASATEIAALDLPAGQYLLVATGTGNNRSTLSGRAACTLTAGTASSGVEAGLAGEATGVPQVWDDAGAIAVVTAASLPSGGRAVLACRRIGASTSIEVRGARLVAAKVGTLLPPVAAPPAAPPPPVPPATPQPPPPPPDR